MFKDISLGSKTLFEAIDDAEYSHMFISLFSPLFTFYSIPLNVIIPTEKCLLLLLLFYLLTKHQNNSRS